MRAGGLTQSLESVWSEDGLRAASVVTALRPGDEAVGDEPVDQARDTALAQQDLARELGHAETPVRRLGELEKGVVLRQ